MKLLLRQEFPLGAFDVLPWRVGSFGDSHAEWLPSPWRLVRAVTARWYEWAREADQEPHLAELEQLQAALCRSTYAFYLPVKPSEDRPLRLDHPTELGRRSVERKGGRTRGCGARLVQDNDRRVPPESAVWWFIESDEWTDHVRALLARCLECVTDLGHAESLTRIRIVESADAPPMTPNCKLVDQPTAGATPVLSPLEGATRDDLERMVDGPETVERGVPPGARWLYAVRPLRPASREHQRAPAHRLDCDLIQFAISWSPAPEPRDVTRLTSRFRGAVVLELLRLKTGDATATWTRVGEDLREAVADMTGKHANGLPLEDHRHAEFLAWCEDGEPTRVLVWRRSRAFDGDEREAILLAAARGVSWAAADYGIDADADAWKVRLVPLDRSVPPPPGFDGKPSVLWESVTPYVPPRHHLRGGKERDGESIANQVRRELAQRGLEQHVEIELIGAPIWVSVHVPRREAGRRALVGERRGQMIRLRFAVPVSGPIRLGHSSSFGLGLLRPAQEPHEP